MSEAKAATRTTCRLSPLEQARPFSPGGGEVGALQQVGAYQARPVSDGSGRSLSRAALASAASSVLSMGCE